MTSRIICFWVIFERPDDFPEHFVMRRQWATQWGVAPEPIAGLYDTLEEARFDVPDGLVRMPRHPADLSRNCGELVLMLDRKSETDEPVRLTLKQQVEALERTAIEDALWRYRWRLGRVADDLGLSRVGLANKMKRYGLRWKDNG